MKAMILAAGLGTRLRPFSTYRPKPLFPVLDVPVLARTINQLRRAGVRAILVNAFYLKDMIIDFLRGEDDVTVQEESQIMGTGGGLRMACDWFGDQPALVVNGDIVHDLDLRKIYEDGCDSGADVFMVLHDCSRFNRVVVDETGRITGFTNGPVSPEAAGLLAYTGIQVVNPAVLRLMADGCRVELIDHYRSLIEKGFDIRAHMVADHFWSDIGTPADYLALHETILRGKGPWRADQDGGTFYVGRNVTLYSEAFSDWVCVGSGATVGRNARLERVVVWDNATVPDNADLRDTIVV